MARKPRSCLKSDGAAPGDRPGVPAKKKGLGFDPKALAVRGGCRVPNQANVDSNDKRD